MIGWDVDKEDAKKTIFINSREIYQKDDDDKSFMSGTQGLIIFHEKTAIIAFRGSEKKLNDWLFNLKAFPVSFKNYIDFEKIAQVENITQEEARRKYSKKAKVHRGFKKAFEAIIPNHTTQAETFNKHIEELKNYDYVWLTGHSLGGAIAIIAANYLQTQGVNISGIYTFGAPRVGNREYREYVDRTFQNKYWRFLHDKDIVADVPPPKVSSRIFSLWTHVTYKRRSR